MWSKLRARVVEAKGISKLRFGSCEICGGKGIRTPDLLIANETLYQLSYDPIPPTTAVIFFAEKE